MIGYCSSSCLNNKHICIMYPLLSLKILIIFCYCVSCLLLFSEARDQQQEQSHMMMNHKLLHEEGLNETDVTAVFVFGDSTVDPGNNNFFKTIAKSTFPPYGRDLIPNHMPTGRFSNGKLTTDFVASYLGTKELVPPYLDPSLSFEDLLTGVSFASAGSGYDPLLPKILVTLTMQKQLELFMEYKAKLQAVIGKKRTEDHIKKAIFIISEGTNDLMITYYLLTLPRLSFTIEEYEKLTLKRSTKFLQDLTDQGAQRIAVVNVPPIGCLPYFMTLKSRGNNIVGRDCIDSYSAVSKDYNKMLKDALDPMKESLANFKGLVGYVDIYTVLQDIIDNYKKYGYEEWSKSCCGTGLIELAFLCNSKSLTCSDASKYVFWDSAHPTEKTYYILFDKAFRKIIDQLVAH